jgi:hypothetical protein
MTESDNIPTAERVTSAITKHIKIYSDNPMHDAIDRIINSCLCIDQDDDYMGMATAEMREAAEELFEITCVRSRALQEKRQRDFNEYKSNKK